MRVDLITAMRENKGLTNTYYLLYRKINEGHGLLYIAIYWIYKLVVLKTKRSVFVGKVFESFMHFNCNNYLLWSYHISLTFNDRVNW